MGAKVCLANPGLVSERPLFQGVRIIHVKGEHFKAPERQSHAAIRTVGLTTQDRAQNKLISKILFA